MRYQRCRAIIRLNYWAASYFSYSTYAFGVSLSYIGLEDFFDSVCSSNTSSKGVSPSYSSTASWHSAMVILDLWRSQLLVSWQQLTCTQKVLGLLNRQNDGREQDSLCSAVTNFEVPKNIYWLYEMSSKHCRQRQPSRQVFLCTPQRDKAIFNVHHTTSSFNDKKHFNADFNYNRCWNEILWLRVMDDGNKL